VQNSELNYSTAKNKITLSTTSTPLSAIDQTKANPISPNPQAKQIKKQRN